MASSVNYEAKDSLLDKCGAGFNIVCGSLTLTGIYSTGGEAMDLSAKFPNALQIVLLETRAGYIFEYDYTAKTVKALYPTKAQTSNLAGTVTTTGTAGVADVTEYAVVFTGEKGTVDAGAGQEVTNGVDITAATGVRFIAIGR